MENKRRQTPGKLPLKHSEELSQSAEPSTTSFADAERNRLMQEFIRADILQLSPQMRTAFKLLFVAGMSKREIAQVLRIPEEDLSSQLREAISAMKTRFKRAWAAKGRSGAGVLTTAELRPYLRSIDEPTESVKKTKADIIKRAVEVIGDEAEALRWLGTPIRALNYATPISLLANPKGIEAVLAVLGRLEHGVL